MNHLLLTGVINLYIEVFERILLQCKCYIIKIVTEVMKKLESIITNATWIKKQNKTT